MPNQSLDSIPCIHYCVAPDKALENYRQSKSTRSSFHSLLPEISASPFIANVRCTIKYPLNAVVVLLADVGLQAFKFLYAGIQQVVRPYRRKPRSPAFARSRDVRWSCLTCPAFHCVASSCRSTSAFGKIYLPPFSNSISRARSARSMVNTASFRTWPIQNGFPNSSP